MRHRTNTQRRPTDTRIVGHFWKKWIKSAPYIEIVVCPHTRIFWIVAGVACSSLAAYTTCSYVPMTLTPSGSAVSAVLSFTTSVTQSAAVPWNIRTIPPGRLLPIVLSCLCCLTLLIYRRRMTRRIAIPVMVVVLGGVLGIAGCNSGSGSGHKTPTGTYTVTVTASGGGVSHAANYTLTVQ